jgi:hypothetical protein
VQVLEICAEEVTEEVMSTNYKPKVTTIGGGTRDFTDDDLKGRPMTICDMTDVVGLGLPDDAEPPTITEHRIAQIRWTPELLIMMGRGRFEVVDNALPDDVEIVSVSTDVRWAYQEIVLTVKSESFAVVPEGAEIPTLPPTVIRRLSEGE